MPHVIHVHGSASTPCREQDVIIVGENNSSTSSNTNRPATTTGENLGRQLQSILEEEERW
jgi:hypothetical protein